MRPLAALLLIAAGPATAADLRDLCPDRPGLDTPPCIVDAGHVLVETGIASWERSHDDASVTHEFAAGNVLARLGLTEHLEVFAGWTAYLHDRVRDRATGSIDRSHGSGDVVFGFKQSLLRPAGDGASIALQAFATAPTGGDFGAGGWTQGLIVPMQFALPGGFTGQLSPEIDRLPDSLRGGHHAAYQIIGGLQHGLGPLTVGAELLVNRDTDPGAAATQALADVNIAWAPSKSLQLDAEVDAGLDRAAPDVRFQLGVSQRF